MSLVSNKDKDERFMQAINLRDSGRYEEALRMFTAWEREALDPNEKLAYVSAALTCLSWLKKYSEGQELIEYGLSLRATEEWGVLRFEVEAASIRSYLCSPNEVANSYSTLLKRHGALLAGSEGHWFRNDIRLRYASALLQCKKTHPTRQVLQLILDDGTDVEHVGRAELSLGLCDYLDGDLSAAVRNLERSIGKIQKPRYIVEARFYLAACHIKAGLYADAITELEFCEQNNDGIVPASLIDELILEAKQQNQRKPM